MTPEDLEALKTQSEQMNPELESLVSLWQKMSVAQGAPVSMASVLVDNLISASAGFATNSATGSLNRLVAARADLLAHIEREVIKAHLD